MSFNSILRGNCNFGHFYWSVIQRHFLDSKLKHKQLWLMLATWINLLLKAYAPLSDFRSGWLYQPIPYRSWTSKQNSFTDFFFHFVADYIVRLPFTILPIFNVLDDLDPNLINIVVIWEPIVGILSVAWYSHFRWMGALRSSVSFHSQSQPLPRWLVLIGGNRVITWGQRLSNIF